MADEPDSPEVDVEALQQLNVEYAAALRTLYGDDFDTVIGDGLSQNPRTGELTWTAPAASDDTVDDTADPPEAELPDKPEPADTARRNVTKPPAALGGRSKPAPRTGYTDDKVRTLSPKEFLSNRREIYEHALKGDSDG